MIVNFSGRPGARCGHEAILRPLGKAKEPMITREVTWKDPRFGTRVKGKIIDTHGSRCYRARFRLGLPGWALGDKAEVQQAPG